MRGPARWTAASLLAAMAQQAVAAERRQTFEVSAAIVRGCAVTADAGGRWGAIALGTIRGLPGASASGTLISGSLPGLALSCTPGTRVSITADAGDHAVAGQRRLVRSGGTEGVAYTLYADGASTAWTTQPVVVTLADTASDRVVPVTATATLTRAMPAGTYTDTVRVTVTF